MAIRKEAIINGQYYHIYSRSIAKFVIFNNGFDYSRMFDLMNLYRFIDFNYRYSEFVDLNIDTQAAIRQSIAKDNNALVEIIAYCIMPTHFHLILKQMADNGIEKFIGRVLNSYTKYFNQAHKRNGPLWASRFKNVRILDDYQLLHLTRYIHLNPTSASLVKNPEDWQYSSYNEYLDNKKAVQCICSNLASLFDITPKRYQKFTLDRRSYQRELSRIKALIIEDYTG